MNWATTIGIVFSTHLRRMIRSKRVLLMLTAAVLPAIPMFFIGTRIGPERQIFAVTDLTWFLVFQVVAPVIALIGGTAAVAEEVVDGTINWVLVRPVSRPAFFLARWLAVLVPVLLAGSLGILAMAAACRYPSEEVYTVTADAWMATMVGLVAYTSVFAAIGAWFKRPVIVGLAYAFAMEALLANLPGTTPEISILHLVRSFVAENGGAWTRILEETRIKTVDGPEALSQLAVLALVALVVGCVATRKRQFGLTVG